MHVAVTLDWWSQMWLNEGNKMAQMQINECKFYSQMWLSEGNNWHRCGYRKVILATEVALQS